MTPLPDLTWVLCDHTGSPLRGSHIAQKRRLVASRNRSMEARLSFGLHDEAAISVFEALRNGIPQLRVYLGNDPTPVFSGHWTPMKGSSAVDSESMVDLVFRDAFDRLAYRWTDVLTTTYTALDAGLIAKDLIDDLATAVVLMPTPTGIATNTAWIEPTKERDRTYVNKNVAEAIIELTEVIEGFDWYPTYLDPRDNAGSTMRFNVAARPAGTDRTSDVRFEYGAGTLENCSGYSFSTSLPITLFRTTGTDPLGGDSQEGGHDAALARYGAYMAVAAFPDVTETATLAEHGFALLRDAPAHVTDFSPDPELSPLPWRDFWVGDTVSWLVDDGAMQEQSAMIVQSIEIGIDDSDNIDDLKIGIDPQGAEKYIAPATSTRRYVQQQQELRRRLAALEG